MTKDRVGGAAFGAEGRGQLQERRGLRRRRVLERGEQASRGLVGPVRRLLVLRAERKRRASAGPKAVSIRSGSSSKWWRKRASKALPRITATEDMPLLWRFDRGIASA